MVMVNHFFIHYWIWFANIFQEVLHLCICSFMFFDNNLSLVLHQENTGLMELTYLPCFYRHITRICFIVIFAFICFFFLWRNKLHTTETRSYLLVRLPKFNQCFIWEAVQGPLFRLCLLQTWAETDGMPGPKYLKVKFPNWSQTEEEVATFFFSSVV